MYTECRDALMECLKQCGATGNIHTSSKKLKLSGESRVFAVLFEDDSLSKNKSRRVYMDSAGKHKRRQKFDRSLTFSVVIGEYSIEKVQELYDKFLESIPDGIYVDGNYVYMEPTVADWMDDEDTIIRAKCAVQVKVVCKGGVYKDTDYAKADDVDVTVNKKEAAYGEEGDGETGAGVSCG